MKKRSKISTSILQNNFKQIYHQFFTHNGLVVSGNFLYPWSPIGIGHRSKILRIKSKLPIKLYTGLSWNSNGNINLGKVYNYNIIQDKFETIEFADLNKHSNRIIEVIKNYLIESGVVEGINIDILTEGTRGHGLGFTGTFAATFSLALHILLGKLDKDYYKKYDEFLSSQIYSQIQLLARKIDFVSRDGNSIGDNSAFSFMNTEYPMVAFSQEFDRQFPIQDLSKLEVVCQSLEKLFSSSMNCQELMCDYAIVFSGTKNDSSRIEQSTKADEKKYNKYSEFVDLTFDDSYKTSDFHFNKFVKKNSMYNSVVDTLAVLNIILLEKFKKLYEDGFGQLAVEEFIAHFNVFSNFISVLESPNQFLIDFVKTFNSNSINPLEKIGIMPIYSGKIGGGFSIVMKYGISRATFNKTIEILRDKYPDIAIDYISWVDGTTGDGVKLEQYINGGIFSKYIDKNNVYLLSNFKGNSVINYNNVFEMDLNDLVVFDTIGKKVYINGQNVSSTELSSQSTTCELMLQILQNPDNEVYNNDLEISSYSKSRNAMLGKILIPLIKLIETKLSKKLALTCTGNSTTYTIKLLDNNVKFFVIKKML